LKVNFASGVDRRPSEEAEAEAEEKESFKDIL
jgi:hypothetical protein